MSFPSKLAPLLLAASIPATAQYTAKKIVFNHPGPYTQTQLEAAAGMHAGTAFKADDLGTAAQKLVDTGYFDGVGATLEGMSNAASVLFDIKPTEHSQMLHVGFENFAWLTHEEIEDSIHAKSPLFAEYLPESSPVADIIAAALTEVLATKGISAEVAHDTVEPTMLQPERVLEFRIVKPAVRVADVKLGGVTQELVPLIQKSVNATARTQFDEGLAGQTTQDRILEPLFDAGYIQASLSGITRTPSPIADGAVALVFSGDTRSRRDISRLRNHLLRHALVFGGSVCCFRQASRRRRRIEKTAPGDAGSTRCGLSQTGIHGCSHQDDSCD